MKRKIFKYIRLFIITITILSFPSVCIPQSELKSTNDNLNKTLDLHAMSVKIEEIQKCIQDLMCNEEFIKTIASSTNSPEKVLKRIKM